MQTTKQTQSLPPFVKYLLIIFGIPASILWVLSIISLIRAGELNSNAIYVSLFMLPALVFLFIYQPFYVRIAGHSPKWILHDRTTGYHLNKPIAFRVLEGVAYVIFAFALFLGLSSFSERGLKQPPPLWFSIAFFFASSAYLAVRLNYRLQPARDERTANEQKIATDEARKAYEATLKPQTPPNVAPLLALATEQLINQRQVIIGTSQDFLPIHYRGEERFRHTYLIGSTGSGKTTVLCNLIAQDIQYGNGVIVLASERDLFDRLLTFIPEWRADDLIYFDATDLASPIIGFNPFTENAGETLAILKRAMGGDMGVSMEPIIDNAVYALRGQSTFADLLRLIDPSDKTFRAKVKNDPALDEDVRTFWERYDKSTYYRKSHDAVRNRFQPFSRQPLSTVLATSSLSFKTHLNKSHIIFLDLSQLQDTALVTMGQLLLASIERSLPSRERLVPYFLYIDEFQKYATDSEKSLIEMFNGARKYKLGVTLAHQSIANIPSKLIDTISDNAQTTIALQLPAVENASYFAKKLRIMKPDRDTPNPAVLQDLDPGYGYVQSPTHKIGVRVSMPEKPVVPLPTPLQGLKARSKQNFGTEPSVPSTEHVTDQPNQPKPPPPQKKKSFGITFE